MENKKLSTPTPVRITNPPYDYYEIFQNVKAMGKQLYGPKYDIDDIDRPVILKLITYFLQDESVADELNIDLYKGLIITGPTGCGKTAIIHILCALMPRDKKRVGSCRLAGAFYYSPGICRHGHLQCNF